MTKLPTAEQTGLPAQTVSSANSAVERVLEESSQLEEGADGVKRKRKYTKTFMPEDRAQVGQHTAQSDEGSKSLQVAEST